MAIDRRTAMALLGAGAASGQHLHTLTSSPQEYKIQFFTPAEYDVVDSVAEMILPADSRSPGAHEAKVAAYIDLVLAFSDAATQRRWRSRLAAFEATSKQRGRKAALDAAARSEAAPSTEAEHFFVDMKALTVEGYYTTRIGLIRELGYKGNEALASFPGCPG